MSTDMDPYGIAIFVMAFRGGPCRELSAWLLDREREGYSVDVGGSPEYGIDVARNQLVNRFLAGPHAHLVMVDQDIVPVPATMPLLTEPGELVWCGYTGRGEAVPPGGRPSPAYGGHYGEGDFGAGCFRASRALLERMERPWFRFDTTPEHDVKLSCECRWFADRAGAAGAEPRMVGVAGHHTDVIAIPTPAGPRFVTP